MASISGSSNLVRRVAVDKYVRPATAAGLHRFDIAVRDVIKDLRNIGFPAENYHQICTSLRTRKFLRENSLEIESMDGPPSKSSPTVVYHFRWSGAGAESKSSLPEAPRMTSEDAAERARQLVEPLLGLLSEELAEYGGGEAFLRWIRSEKEDAAKAHRAAEDASNGNAA